MGLHFSKEKNVGLYSIKNPCQTLKKNKFWLKSGDK